MYLRYSTELRVGTFKSSSRLLERVWFFSEIRSFFIFVYLINSNWIECMNLNIILTIFNRFTSILEIGANRRENWKVLSSRMLRIIRILRAGLTPCSALAFQEGEQSFRCVRGFEHHLQVDFFSKLIN